MSHSWLVGPFAHVHLVFGVFYETSQGLRITFYYPICKTYNALNFASNRMNALI